MTTTPVLVLPGYGDSGPEHWQSLWQAEDPACRRVVQRDWMLPRLEDWLDTLARHVAECEGPPVLVAHSLGGLVCMRYVLSRLARGEPPPVRGLLLYATPTTGTLLVNIAHDLGIPLLGGIVRANTFETALKLINEHEYGNGTAIFTRDGDTARTFAHTVKAGMVGAVPGQTALLQLKGENSSRFVVLERAGHINADAGFGVWPQGRMFLRELTCAS